MKIIIICGSFEPGRDGVGDYSRRLGLEMLRIGHQVAVMSIFDKDVKEVQNSKLSAAEGEISVLRLPKDLDKQSGLVLMKEFIDQFDPEWLSLQYVPFAFHPKGLDFSLAKRLKIAGGGRKWQLMVHEICVGMHAGTSMKLLVWGEVQKYLAKDVLKALKPVLVNTHTTVYQKQLEKFGAVVTLLPLFSNIPLLYPELVEAKLNKSKTEDDTIDLLVFASIQEGAPVAELAAEAKKYEQEQGVNLRLVIIGRSGKEQERWVNIWRNAGLKALQLGEQNEEQVSQILAQATFGIFTTPLILVKKSGAVAAMREHGINLLCVSRSWEARGIAVKENPYHLIQYKRGDLTAFLESRPDFSELPTVASVAQQFNKELLTH